MRQLNKLFITFVISIGLLVFGAKQILAGNERLHDIAGMGMLGNTCEFSSGQLTLSSMFSGTNNHEACESVTYDGAVISSGETTATAGSEVVLKNGFTVKQGATFRVTIVNQEFDDRLLMPAEGGDGPAYNDGAAWESYNRGARLKWKNVGGDYVDRDGVLQGDTAWSSETIIDMNTVQHIFWDTTELVQAWHAGEVSNRGFHVRHIDGSAGPIDYASKEAAELSHRPELHIETQEEGAHVLQALGDTYLYHQSKTETNGQRDELQVDNLRNLLVWFDISPVAGQIITSAQLKLTSIAQYTNTNTVHGLFATVTDDWDTSAPIMGIANNYPNDVGITDDENVYLAYNFNSDAAQDGGQDMLNGSIDLLYAENYWSCEENYPSGLQADGSWSEPAPAIPGFQTLDGNALCMRLKYEPGPIYQGTGNWGHGIKKPVSDFADTADVEELFVRVYLYFGETWGENLMDQGGKRPGGISGTYSRTPYEGGWGGRRTDGTNGWSARGGYNEIVPSIDNPLAGYTTMGTYLYWADQTSGNGTTIDWTLTPNGVLKKGRWYSLEQQIRMNTRDGANIHNESGSHDGVIRGWVDGRLVFERTDIRFTDMDYINIDVADFGFYYGGVKNTPYDQHIAMDNIVIAKEYIGPMRIE
ncbi:disaggregatase related repeat-containing protein [Gilvimarinus sp. SDUM040013]|uniref:Disaggregatase related repeat-containing protein n=1 Tax=Gilvimarinus gilvus TaxID=3058038 RepID=A0ABU4S759_9GAMM|nr:disaggregatase related repeat-containing protein [Gilvimarinus sp. SDUM040013]MDO3385658.1 disaggregatase related repeat-containing protein [Gilvimarinus sp. SDUM040013]MDX6851514.1 disaggregatase related repeat-containing protein [Gilvimarinus sp. SDUM040013]